MASGLSVNIGGFGGAGFGQSGFSSTSAPRTATEAGFGQQYTDTGAPSRSNALTPNDPFGVAFWSGVLALGVLLYIRHTLPA